MRTTVDLVPELTILQMYMQEHTVKLLPDGQSFGTPEKMQNMADKLRKNIEGLVGGVGNLSRVCNAIQAVRRKKIESLTRPELRALCQGLRHSCNDCGNMIPMQYPRETFISLMEFISKAFEAQYLKSISWYGLLYTYFNSPEKDNSWEILRNTLERTLPVVKKHDGFNFAWLKTISDHRAVLTKTPCMSLAKQILEGDSSGVEQLSEALKIPENSWFWKELVLAQVRHATERSDDVFIRLLPTLIKSSAPTSLLMKDEVIGLLLTRYSKCRSRGAQTELKEFTLNHWGTPNLGRHQKYDLVAADVKQMVQEWVARDDLKDFFTLLQDDGVTDERRLAFWSRYIKQIEYHRILLGGHAWRSMQCDFIELRKKASVGKLTGTTGNNNAFAMKIGDWVFIASSEKGVALYGYKHSHLPFKMDDGQVAISDYRDKDNCDFRAIQKDKRSETWEENFTLQLAQFGIEPDERPAKSHVKSNFFSSRPQPQHDSDQNAATPKNNFDEAAFWKVVKEHNLTVGDNRHRGGAIWIQGKVPSHLKQTITKWGFQYKLARGWWRNG